MEHTELFAFMREYDFADALAVLKSESPHTLSVVLSCMEAVPAAAVLQALGAEAQNAVVPLKGDTLIGNDVWIGQNAVILPGVHIGDGAIIGANATVASDFPPYTVSAGNPARIIRKRFDDELIDLLERFKWWDKPIEEINALIPILTNGDVENVRTELKKRLM